MGFRDTDPMGTGRAYEGIFGLSEANPAIGGPNSAVQGLEDSERLDGSMPLMIWSSSGNPTVVFWR